MWECENIVNFLPSTLSLSHILPAHTVCLKKKERQWAQNGVTYTRPLVTKLRFNSFSSLRNRNLNQSIRNHLIST